MTIHTTYTTNFHLINSFVNAVLILCSHFKPTCAQTNSESNRLTVKKHPMLLNHWYKLMKFKDDLYKD